MKILLRLLFVYLCAITNIAYASNYIQPQNSTEEYINRIGKRLVIVSDQPEVNYNFKVLDSKTPQIALDQENNYILVSIGLLKLLNNEAELAAMLTLCMIKYSNYTNLESEPEPDYNSAKYLYRAGYDPQALVDLQKQYMYSNNTNTPHWLSLIYPTAISPGSIYYNQEIISTMPKGLLREEKSYIDQMNKY